MLSLGSIATKFFGSSNDRQIKSYRPRVEQINALEPELAKLSDDELKARTQQFRERIANGETLDALLPEAFATVREAAKRTLGQRHFDVQMIGGMVLHEGKIAEMKTGEGKTLVATLPVYLNALAGNGVHVVTVNDYLASRDAGWMGQVYKFLGLEVGCIVHGLTQEERRTAYAADVTYGTNNELGFDYLRDNMEHSIADMVQRGHSYAIVDEVDSILIDEARTPLIISGPIEDRTELYNAVNKVVLELEPEAYEIDLKQRQVTFTEPGNEILENLLRDAELLQGDTLYDLENVRLVHHVNNALKAQRLFERDRDYIVKNDEVVLIDEFTGRMMPGRRFSDGLHQALEAKEGVKIQPENQTLASVTFQNYFRLYDKLAGMTGTASTEASEFMDIYGLDVLEIPTNVEVARQDEDDEVYRTVAEKYDAIAMEIIDCHRRGQPVLVGTTSIAKSETLAGMLGDRKYLSDLADRIATRADGMKDGEADEFREYLRTNAAFIKELARKAKSEQAGVPLQVLNARFHEQEARIVAQAGVPGAVTIATNMAGRGTDIQLGGNIDMQIAEWVAEQTKDGKEPDKAAIDARRKDLQAEIDKMKRAALDAGGLYVMGTERHESRRIDNQLRGRSGRQGDPGRSKFYLSLEDDLMKIFGSDRMDGMLSRLGLRDGEAIIHSWINKALEKAQQKVEARNFDARKNILKYDDVMNDQRKVIFEQRVELMSTESVRDTVEEMRHEVIEDLVNKHIPPNAYAEQWDIEGLKAEVLDTFGLDLPIDAWAAEEGIADQEVHDRLTEAVDAKAAKIVLDIGNSILSQHDDAAKFVARVHEEAEKAEGYVPQELMQDYVQARSMMEVVEQSATRSAGEIGRTAIQHHEKGVLLRILDGLWREHLVTLEHLREVVGLRGYGQRDPLNEYKTEAFMLFEEMLGRLRLVVTKNLMHIDTSSPAPEPEPEPLDFSQFEAHHTNPLSGEDEFALAEMEMAEGGRPAPLRSRKAASNMNPNDPSTWGKIARNAPCPCGSGKKFKHCHGRS